MRVEDVKAYEILQNREIKDLNSQGYLLRHKKTGARVALLSNDDENKVFYIGFRTPPTDSTGVAHIIEHTVLCGSEKYPIKDPFVELVKGSLNTFLNAITYPDKTVYPVASCNDKDFQNLCDVYMDAVLHPNIYKTDMIFAQEGWHYELEDVDSELKLNGVVYSEMKGAFSSPDGVLSREVFSSLFPDTTYGVESGGDPDVIPTLTYENYLNFHRTYYHPSNSYIYLYGNMDMAEKLVWLDEQYLSDYDHLDVDSAVAMQKEFGKGSIREVEKSYPITDAESEEDAGYLTYNCALGTSLDQKKQLAFQILDYALCSVPGAPLKQALIEKGIGQEISSALDNELLQPYYTIAAKKADIGRKEEFLATIREVLDGLVKNGIEEKALRAAVNMMEFKYREADFGSFPKGLIYGLQMLGSWLYDDNEPFMYAEIGEAFAYLREQIGTDYYTELVRNYLLDSAHASTVTLKPEKGLTAKKDKELAEKLAAHKASLSAEEKEALVARTKALRAFQEAEDSKEDLEKIPLLTRQDIEPKTAKLVNEERDENGTKVLYHNVFTNGIGYVRFVFDMSKLPSGLYPYAGLLKAVLGNIDTEHYSYNDLNNEIGMNTGGFQTGVGVYSNLKKPGEFKSVFDLRIKAFYNSLPEAFTLMTEMMLRSKLDDGKRLKEILDETCSQMESYAMSAGHALAAGRAMSYFSKAELASDMTNGYAFYCEAKELSDHFEERKDEIVKKLVQVMKSVFRPENLMLDYTAEEKGYQLIPQLLAGVVQELYTEPVEQRAFDCEPVKKNEGFFTAGKVQYVCRAGNFRAAGLPYTGALLVLRTIMSYDYLWFNVRVKGGAYGCMTLVSRNGNVCFVSYRDPNLQKTVETYEGAVAYLKGFSADEREMTKYVIGTMSDLDVPLTPSAKGSRSLTAYLSGYGNEELQKERDEVLHVTVEDIRALADYIQAMLDEGSICVVGNEDEIRKNDTFFMNMGNLVQ
ncbi:MAG: insulinase family protein [Clostridium sp.]|nr:insulinase family protein [Clostridium sp.]